jgi:hypothetical protein
MTLAIWSGGHVVLVGPLAGVDAVGVHVVGGQVEGAPDEAGGEALEDIGGLARGARAGGRDPGGADGPGVLDLEGGGDASGDGAGGDDGG